MCPDDPATERADAAAADAATALDIGTLQRELEAARDRALRAQAELDNYRKRLLRELDEERRYASLPLLSDLLPVLDNLSRAIEAGEKQGESGGLLTGVKMVVQQIEGVLEKHHCLRIAALEGPFDPNLHQAIAQQPSANVPPNTVVAVAQAGFRLHDRVIRPSQVVVSSAPAS